MPPTRTAQAPITAQSPVGDVTKFRYDGFDRRNITTNAVGTRVLRHFDPEGNVVSSACTGPVGRPSPVSNLGSNNVNLNITDFSYDERSRLYQRDRVLFLSPGFVPQRPVTITDGSLTPGDGKVTTRYEYDRNSRMAFVVDDDSNTARLVHDEANRLTKAVDPENNSLEWAYDGNGNAIETRTTDACQVSGVPSEVFLTTCFYDSLNRLQQRVDNIGESLDYRYDSRNNLVAASDANGPLSGTIARRAFGAGAQTQNTINGFGNVTLYSYDGLNRRTRQDQVLTASGLGDGTNNGANIFGVKTSTPTPDQSQGGGDGLITAYTNTTAIRC